MKKTAKFAVSMPATEFEDLESRRRSEGKTRSGFILEAVRAWRKGAEDRGVSGVLKDFIREDPGRYGGDRPHHEAPTPKPLTDITELRRRAAAAAGRFRSEEGDLSLRHDEALADDFAGTAAPQSSDRRPKFRRKR